jgi:uncharacterized protein
MTEPAEAEPDQPRGAEPDQRSEVGPRWGLGDAALAFAAGLIGTIFTTSVYLIVSGVEADAQDTGLIIATLVGLWLGFGLVAILASLRKGAGSLAEDYGLRLELKDVPVGVVVGLVCQFVVIPVVVTLFSLLDDTIDVAQQAEEVTGGASGVNLLLLAPFLCIGAPFFEELYFRGLLQRAAVRRLRPVAGIALSALAFGLVHANALSGWSALALVAALAVFGVVLSSLAHRTGRLGPGLVAHFTFNAVSLVALALN